MNDTTGLWKIATAKADEYAGRADVVAVAVTGSVARGKIWHGSDVDLWAFTAQDPGEEDFFDGMAGETYWEIDLKPVSWLTETTADEWLIPPPLYGHDGVTPVEALWGCIVHTDRVGTLTRVAAHVAEKMADHGWLQQRATNYLNYGLGALDALAEYPARSAILTARAIADKYAVAAHWMKQGVLLSSIMRLPERLADWPKIHDLYCQIWSLNGEAGARNFTAVYQSLPADVRAPFEQDYRFEYLPALKHGLYNGAVHYLRDHMSETPDHFTPLLALADDLDAQKTDVLGWTRELLARVRDEPGRG